MTTYKCIPSVTTVPPCPSGTAPAETYIDSSEIPEYYGGSFGHVPLQDVSVVVAMVLSLLLGIMAGRR